MSRVTLCSLIIFLTRTWSAGRQCDKGMFSVENTALHVVGVCMRMCVGIRACAYHVMLGDAFCDANHQRQLLLDRLQDGGRCKGRWHVDDGRVCTRCRLGFGDTVEDRQAQVRGATLFRCHAPNHVGAICNRLLGVKSAILSSDALAYNLCCLIYKHSGLLRGSGLRQWQRRCSSCGTMVCMCELCLLRTAATLLCLCSDMEAFRSQ